MMATRRPAVHVKVASFPQAALAFQQVVAELQLETEARETLAGLVVALAISAVTDAILLEDGEELVLEDGVTQVLTGAPDPGADGILLENRDTMLLATGDVLELEDGSYHEALVEADAQMRLLGIRGPRIPLAATLQTAPPTTIEDAAVE